MTDQSKALVQAQFGANAANYATSSVHAKGASLSRLVELVQPKANWSALDVATGAGHTAAAFAPLVASVIASDITPEMLAEAKKIAADKGLSNMTTATADAEKLPFADATFDLVTCRIAPHHFPNIEAFAAEVTRVLKPGGTFALVDNISPDASTTTGFADAALEDAEKAYNAFEKLRDPSHGRALTTGEWQDVVLDAGMTITHIEHQPKAMDFAAWCKNMSVDAPTTERLTAMLDNASPALQSFLQPTNLYGKRSMVLSELILIATKDA
ncbi:MAG: methyltransferase domain-containing protein [Hyphomicrobiaceae bacterium]|nr:methyltransferase domain-containing protein [Hyphomicrobiaceae bacterium]